MIDYCKLLLSFNPRRLEAESGRVLPEEWTPHYNERDYEGNWSGAALRSVSGSTSSLFPDLSGRIAFADTPLLARCSYFRTILDNFLCPLRSVRLLRLEPGARVREHRDDRLCLEDGEVRLHIPVTTNPDVDFVVNGVKLAMKAGEVWYINFTLPHRVSNRGTTDRIHLVLDCTPNDWLRGQLQSATASPGSRQDSVPAAETPASSSAENLDRFRVIVLADPGLQEEFRGIGDCDIFVDRVVSLGLARGLAVTASDVLEAMRASRRAALDREAS